MNMEESVQQLIMQAIQELLDHQVMPFFPQYKKREHLEHHDLECLLKGKRSVALADNSSLEIAKAFKQCLPTVVNPLTRNND